MTLELPQPSYNHEERTCREWREKGAESEGKAVSQWDGSGLWIKPRLNLNPPRVFYYVSQEIPFVLKSSGGLILFCLWQKDSYQMCQLPKINRKSLKHKDEFPNEALTRFHESFAFLLLT